MDKLKIIITGATGMVGEGVLHEALLHPDVDKVLVITRKSCGNSHPKLTEIVHNDFFDISSLDSVLKDYNACFFCLGVTALGKTEAEYTRLTYTLTLNFATTIAALNPDMIFCYISGAGTDSTEKGRTMWARVKGKTENDLIKLPFRQVYNFRPGGIQPFLPLNPSQTYYKTYKYLGWLFSLIKVIAPNYVITLKDLAAAMINALLTGYPKNIVEMKEMKILAKASVKK
jgi:uncharacterized protein YbjT (DUF2867 family)